MCPLELYLTWSLGSGVRLYHNNEPEDETLTDYFGDPESFKVDCIDSARTSCLPWPRSWSVNIVLSIDSELSPSSNDEVGDWVPTNSFGEWELSEIYT